LSKELLLFLKVAFITWVVCLRIHKTFESLYLTFAIKIEVQ